MIMTFAAQHAEPASARRDDIVMIIARVLRRGRCGG
jgi:hypothetical protein